MQTTSRYLGTREQAMQFARRLGRNMSPSEYAQAQFGSPGVVTAKSDYGWWYETAEGNRLRITTSYDESLLVEGIYDRQRRGESMQPLAPVLSMGSVTAAVSVPVGDQPLLWYVLPEIKAASFLGAAKERELAQTIHALGFDLPMGVAGGVGLLPTYHLAFIRFDWLRHHQGEA